MLGSRWRSTVLEDASGAAAIEFAIVGPLLFVLLLGILSYGGYFWTAHAVQQLANNGARAAIAGLDSTERRSLAEASMQEELAAYDTLRPEAASLTIDDEPDRLAVRISYDASSTPFFALSRLIPMPSSTIRRQAVVRLGGY
jgi:Flp pilus assembly protein TadG